jgi:hypothetical protein
LSNETLLLIGRGGSVSESESSSIAAAKLFLMGRLGVKLAAENEKYATESNSIAVSKLIGYLLIATC